MSLAGTDDGTGKPMKTVKSWVIRTDWKTRRARGARTIAVRVAVTYKGTDLPSYKSQVISWDPGSHLP